jgi:hypothetical protein
MTKATRIAMVIMVTKDINHASLYDPLATGARVDLTSQVSSSVSLLSLPMVGK